LGRVEQVKTCVADVFQVGGVYILWP